jgi:hypothetical protein
MKYWALCFDIQQEAHIESLELHSAQVLLDTYREYSQGEPWAVLGQDKGTRRLSGALPVDVGMDVNMLSQEDLARISDEQFLDAIQRGMNLPVWLGLRDTRKFIEMLSRQRLVWTGQLRVDEGFLRSYPRRRRWMKLVNTMVSSCDGMVSALPGGNEILVLPLGVDIFSSCERTTRTCFGPPQNPSW